MLLSRSFFKEDIDEDIDHDDFFGIRCHRNYTTSSASTIPKEWFQMDRLVQFLGLEREFLAGGTCDGRWRISMRGCEKLHGEKEKWVWIWEKTKAFGSRRVWFVLSDEECWFLFLVYLISLILFESFSPLLENLQQGSLEMGGFFPWDVKSYDRIRESVGVKTTIGNGKTLDERTGWMDGYHHKEYSVYLLLKGFLGLNS